MDVSGCYGGKIITSGLDYASAVPGMQLRLGNFAKDINRVVVVALTEPVPDVSAARLGKVTSGGLLIAAYDPEGESVLCGDDIEIVR